MAGESTGAILTAASANLAIAVAKFAGFWLTGSSAMLAEGVHSIVDTTNQGLLLIGLKRAKRRPDPAHPFGYGREIYFYSFVVALMIFFVGGLYTLYEGYEKIRKPAVEGDVDLLGVHLSGLSINLAILGFSIVCEGYSLWKAYTSLPEGSGPPLSAIRRSKDPSLFVTVAEDLAAVIGLILAALGVGLANVLGIPALDGAASIGIGLLLVGMASFLMVETHGLLIGEAADPEIAQAFRKLAGREPIVRSVNEVLTQHMGPADILVNVSLDIADDSRGGDVEQLASRLECALRERHPAVRRMFIEFQSAQASKRFAGALESTT